MGAKGGPKTGGRKKGSINKATASVQAKLEKIGLDPIASMAQLVKDEIKLGEDMDKSLVKDLLKELAQYVAPKRRAVEVDAEVSGPEGGPIEVSRIELVAPNIDSTN
jgi:hypothetical protein